MEPSAFRGPLLQSLDVFKWNSVVIQLVGLSIADLRSDWPLQLTASADRRHIK